MPSVDKVLRPSAALRAPRDDRLVDYAADAVHERLPVTTVAAGVHALEVGAGMLRSNVYFVQSGSAWFLIDAASAGCERVIEEVAAELFGPESRPAAILLTHIHPDHSGACPGLCQVL